MVNPPRRALIFASARIAFAANPALRLRRSAAPRSVVCRGAPAPAPLLEEAERVVEAVERTGFSPTATGKRLHEWIIKSGSLPEKSRYGIPPVVILLIREALVVLILMYWFRLVDYLLQRSRSALVKAVRNSRRILYKSETPEPRKQQALETLGSFWAWSELVGRASKLPAQLSVLFAALWRWIHMFNPAFSDLFVAWKLNLVFVLSLFVFRIKQNAFEKFLQTRNAEDQGALIFATERLLDLAILVFFMTSLQTYVGINLRPLFALGGIGGIAFGFASQDLVANLFGGFFVYLTTPFSPGDEISSGAVTGKVLSTNWYSTTLIDPDNNEIMAPNATFTSTVLTNRSRRKLHPFREEIVVPSSALPYAKAMTFAMRRCLRDNPVVDGRTHEPSAYVSPPPNFITPNENK